ncbi:MAG: IS200/IS605 family transposase, partial [Finegoldia magna]|nr:IS200/IS605 family transposase [Finegoldia magna]
MKIQANRHSIYELQYHLVVVTKYRKKIINDKIKDELTDIAINIFENSYNGKIVEINTDKDYIHILFSV